MNLPNEVFVDISFFIALLNSKDKFHQKAANLQEILFAKVIIVLAKKNPVKKQG